MENPFGQTHTAAISFVPVIAHHAATIATTSTYATEHKAHQPAGLESR